MVDTKQVPFDLPNMRINPFNIKPLNPKDKQLLVGRNEIISKIIGWCKHRSSRMILLIGNRGTGRTSLLNLVGNEAFKHFQFNIFPTKDPMKNLLEELYITVVSDFEVPRMHQQLQENLINSIPETGRLPILSFDYPNMAGSEIADVFKQLSQILRSLDAVSIIALTPAQLATWPQELIDEFDEEIKINSFNNSEIHGMIAKRVSSTCREKWKPTKGLVDEIQERTSGHPSESIKLMRKIVHNIKNKEDYDSELNQLFSNIKSKTNDDDPAETQEETIEDQIEEDITEDYEETEGVFEEPQEGELQEEELQDDQIEYDYEELEASQINDEESYFVENNEEYNKIIPGEIEEPPLPTGVFGKLGGRTRNRNKSMRKDGFAVFRSDLETMKKLQDNSPTDAPILETEDVALWIDEQIISNTTFGNEFANEKVQNKIKIQEENAFENTLKGIQENKIFYPPEQSFNLDIERLRSLDNNEIKVIQLCSKREISPSDEEMRNILGGIGRTRVSQIFNGLHKHGILSVKKMGRSRMFYLSNSAKSQLMAWGKL
tara:strand:+ start:1317 stop:2957 length:1641 start_codon:yes stop_codon:yes gene_type:complete